MASTMELPKKEWASKMALPILLGAFMIAFVMYNVGYNDGFKRGFNVCFKMFTHGKMREDGTLVWSANENGEKNEQKNP